MTGLVWWAHFSCLAGDDTDYLLANRLPVSTIVILAVFRLAVDFLWFDGDPDIGSDLQLGQSSCAFGPVSSVH